MSSTDTAVNPLPQLACQTTPFPPRRSNPLSPQEHYRRDATPAQRGRPQVDRRGTPTVGSGCVTLPRGLEVVVGIAGTSTNPIDIPDSTPPTPTVVWCFQCRSTNHVHPQCPEYICYVVCVIRSLSSAHSSVVRGHIEFQTLGSFSSDNKKSMRLKPRWEFQGRD